MVYKSEIQDVLKKLYDEKQKQLDREAAHSLLAYVSSLRILLGAYNSGDVVEEKFIEILNSMKATLNTNFDVNGYLKESGSFRRSIKKPKATLSSEISKSKGKILLIDDEYKSVGWDMVFNAIFGDDNVLYADNKDKALSYIKENDEIAVIYLDLKLPSSPEEGIELLREIKKERLDLPVVIFTGEDTVKFQRYCFLEGAFDYFVKAYREEDKNYLDYYETFKDITLSALKFSGKSDIWKKISQLDKDIKKAGPPHFEDTIHYLRKAYFFLTIDKDNWFTTILLSKNNITYYGEVIIQCSLALEGLINMLFDDKKNDKTIKIIARNRTSENIPYGDKLQGLKTLRILDEKSEKVAQKINELRIKCVHPKRKGLIINEEEAISALSKTIDTARQVIFSEHMLGLIAI